MRKVHTLETAFNEQLLPHELLLKFRGDTEMILIGAPSGRLRYRIAISIMGIAMVSFCLVSGEHPQYSNTLMIGGSLLGLILICTPLVSFYSKKQFKILISKRLRQISITSSIISPDKRIDFSNIESLLIKHTQIDDLISGKDDTRSISYIHSFNVVADGKQIELFTLDSHDESFKQFVEKFANYLSKFTDKELEYVTV